MTLFLQSYGGALVPRVMTRGVLLPCVLGLAISGMPTAVHAESMFDALVSAYVSNPALNAARKGLQATDEEVPRARSGWRPTVVATGDIVYTDTNTDPVSLLEREDTAKSYSVSVSQPIFRGFRTLNSVREAEATVRAGRQDLKGAEQETLLAAVTAYMDVVRDQSVVFLRRQNVRFLTKELEGTEARKTIGSVTQTDVEQSKARRAAAMSQLAIARGTLKTSKAEYKRVVGHLPKKLRFPTRYSQVLPHSINEAVLVGMEENPLIIAAQFRSQASRHAVDSVRGELLPTVDLEASYSKVYDSATVGADDLETTTVAGRLTVPLYQAGDVAARIRQSKHSFLQSQDLLDDARDTVRAQIVSSWSSYEAAKSAVASDRAQVAANKAALEGVTEEEKVGQRTILDVLDAEQERVNSEIALVSSRRDVVVTAFSVLSAVGRLTATDLGLPVEYYDPEEHYRQVRRKWFGTGPRLPRP